jgi:hypothetical protein
MQEMEVRNRWDSRRGSERQAHHTGPAALCQREYWTVLAKRSIRHIYLFTEEAQATSRGKAHGRREPSRSAIVTVASRVSAWLSRWRTSLEIFANFHIA